MSESSGSLSQTRGRPEPGRELDALIAEKVMGFTWDESRCRICGWHLASDVVNGCVPDNCSLRPAPAKRADSPEPYSTDIAAAWTVVEEMNSWVLAHSIGEVDVAPWREANYFALACLGGLGTRHGGGWAATFCCTTREDWHEEPLEYGAVRAEDAPHAICLAALAALSPADDGGAR